MKYRQYQWNQNTTNKNCSKSQQFYENAIVANVCVEGITSSMMYKCDSNYWRRYIYSQNNECQGEVSNIQIVAEDGCDSSGNRFEILECGMSVSYPLDYQSVFVWIKDIFIVFLIIVIFIKSVLEAL